MLAKGKVLTSDTKFNQGEFKSMQKLARFWLQGVEVLEE